MVANASTAATLRRCCYSKWSIADNKRDGQYLMTSLTLSMAVGAVQVDGTPVFVMYIGICYVEATGERCPCCAHTVVHMFTVNICSDTGMHEMRCMIRWKFA